jgi:hypothetical protein
MDPLDPRKSLRKRPAPPPVGTLIRRVALGSEATYRVLSENRRGIEVEVVDAPGLAPGARFTFAIDDVVAMTDLGEDDRAARAVRPTVPQRRLA